MSAYLNQSMWIHGNSMQIEDPEQLQSFRRTASYTRVEGKAGTANWFHFAVPTPTIVDNDSMKVAAVFLRFKSASSDAYVKEIHLYDGEKRFAEFNDLSLSPEEFCTERFDPQLYEIQYGLGVSLFVVFGDKSTSHVMKFSSAGCNFARSIDSQTKRKKSSTTQRSKKLRNRR